MSFQFHPLDKSQFDKFFAMGADELDRTHSVLMNAEGGGCPCRVSLQDAKPGEAVLLTPFQHQDAKTPYRSSHAIFVRKDAVQAEPKVGEVPEYLLHRLISLRGFSKADMLIAAEVSEGSRLQQVLVDMLSDDTVAYIHVHNAREGCFHAKVTRSVQQN